MYATLNFIAIWLPRVFFGLVLVFAVWAYDRLRQGMKPKWIGLRGLVIASITFKFVYAALLTVGQYFIWKNNSFTNLLISHSGGVTGYFATYSWGRFWVEAVGSVVLAMLFWFILKVLQKHNDRFFHPGETELGFIAALIVGWPNLLLFVPLVFLSVVLVSIYRLIFLRESYTTMSWPLLLAVIFTFAAAHFLGSALDLSFWKIY